MTTQVNVAEAKAHLSDLVERAAGGEDIVITRAGRPRVRLVPVAVRPQPRVAGALRGQVDFLDRWEEDLTEDFEVLRDEPR